MSSYGALPLAPASPPPRVYHRGNDERGFNPDAHVGLSEHHSRRSRIPYKSLLPSIAIFLSTAGFGLGVLVWLLVKLKITVAEAFRDGHFLVDEGVKELGGSLDSANLRALTATSFISSMVPATSPFLMALIAYSIAYLWATEEHEALSTGETEAGPTPLQYGLLLQVLSAHSISSLLKSVRYALRKKSRVQAPSFFGTAVLFGVVVTGLTQLVGLADVWMHSATPAVLYNVTRPGDSASLDAPILFNDTLCNPRNGDSGVICLAAHAAWAWHEEDNVNHGLVVEGQSIIGNYSLDRRIITLADEEDLAIAVPLRIDSLAKFTASTYGALAQCESLNTLCDGTPWFYQETEYRAGLSCSRLGINVLPHINDTSPYRSIAFVSPYRAWNDTPFEDRFFYGPTQCCGENPVRSVLQLRWSSQRGNGPFHVPNPAVETHRTGLLSIYARCNLIFYNVTVAYDGRAGGEKYWSVQPGGRIMSSNVFASTLSGPFAWQFVSDTLTSNIKSRVVSATSSEQVMAALNQELARLALGYVASAFIFVPADNVTIFHPTILGRYPIVPTLTFVGLLLVYGLIALAVCAMSFNLKSGVISVPPALQGGSSDMDGGEVSALELAQLRLLSPLPLVAQMFEPPVRSLSDLGPDDADARSVALDEMDLFTEDKSTARLRLGLEAANLRPRYGIWRRDERGKCVTCDCHGPK